MKSLRNAIAVLLLSAATLVAVNLAWCPSPDSWVTGYAIYYGTGTTTNWSPQIVSNYVPSDPCSPMVIISPGSNWLRHYTVRVDVGNRTECTFTNLTPGVTYYIAAVSIAADGQESIPSNEISHTEPFPQTNTLPSAVENFQLDKVTASQ